MLVKSILRTIKKTLARYLAILAIIALGVGFFAGLRVTEKSMHKTGDKYINDNKLFDYKLVSTIGFSFLDTSMFSNIEGIDNAYGSTSFDVIINEDNSDYVLHAHSLLDEINKVELLKGRMPEKDNECLLDGLYFDEKYLGKTIKLSQNNPLDTKSKFKYDEYVVVGLINSVEYTNFQRGVTSLSNGSVEGYTYLLQEGFNVNYYTEIYLKLTKNYEIYSKEYSKVINNLKPQIEDVLKECVNNRYNLIKEFITSENSLELPTFYVLDRYSNYGYLSFENDITIVSGVAKVFPVFFFLVAALVCITTMTRMVNEQRTQNGILKALGYNNFAVISQYLVYAGSASLIGSIIGFLIGSKFMPMVMWEIYQIMYAINRPIKFILDWKLFIICITLYLICILGVTYFVCKKDLKSCSATLMRPQSPNVGKRIFLERIGFIWKPLKFLYKISLRNIFRYKKRIVMMIIGIGGCTALLLTGFGVRDTIQPILDYQYGEISLYDATANFINEPSNLEMTSFKENVQEFCSEISFVHSGSVDLTKGSKTKTSNIVVYNEDMSFFIDLHNGNRKIKWPNKNEAVINNQMAKKLNINTGDTVKIRDSNYKEATVLITGIYENYIGNVIYISEETYQECFGYTPNINTVYLNFLDDIDHYKAGAKILQIENIASVSIINDMKQMVSGMLDSLNLIVVVVLICAALLAFIVLYNLTNITIKERSREIATLKVLGFHKSEQQAYVFRENIILTIISAIFGVPLGILLLRYTMAQIKIDGFYFGCRLNFMSYLISILLTLIFTIFVNFALSFKLKRINMAEAMKAIE